MRKPIRFCVLLLTALSALSSSAFAHEPDEDEGELLLSYRRRDYEKIVGNKIVIQDLIQWLDAQGGMTEGRITGRNIYSMDGIGMAAVDLLEIKTDLQKIFQEGQPFEGRRYGIASGSWLGITKLNGGQFARAFQEIAETDPAADPYAELATDEQLQRLCEYVLLAPVRH